MEGRMLHLALFLFVLLIPEKAYSGSIKGSKKLDYQENQMVFPSRAMIVQKDTPIVNPTTPGSSPIVNPTSPDPPTTAGPSNPGSSGGAWCIANPSASPTALQVALDYACGYGGTDCSALQPNAPCFEPNTVADHASYAFNDYYQKNPVPTSCVFGGAAQLSYTDPSHGNCHFASPSSTPTMPPPTPTTMPPPTPTIPTTTPPSPTMPTSPDTPIGGDGDGTDPADNDYGGEPTGSPSSAEIVSSDLVLLITTSWLMVPLIISSLV